MITRRTIGLVLAGSIFFGTSLGQQRIAGCRPLAQQVWYDPAPGRGPHVRVVTATANVASGMLVSERNGRFYGTSDSGSRWSALDGIPWDILGHFPGSVFAPSDPRVVYSYENIGIVKRSLDGGKTWTIAQPRIEGTSGTEKAFAVSSDSSYVLKVTIGAVHPLKPLTIYGTMRVGPREGSVANFGPRYFLKGMYISEDGGDNWKRFSDQVGVFDKYPRDVVLGVNPDAPNIMLSEGETGILRSSDGGSTWLPVGQSEILNQEPLDTQERAEGILVPIKKGVLNVSDFVFDPSSVKIVYMISPKGVHRSLDGGDTWVLLNVGFDHLGAISSLVIDPFQPERVYVGTDRGLFRSEDRGCSFSPMASPKP